MVIQSRVKSSGTAKTLLFRPAEKFNSSRLNSITQNQRTQIHQKFPLLGSDGKKAGADTDITAHIGSTQIAHIIKIKFSAKASQSQPDKRFYRIAMP
jgi:hypothetical protein